MADNQKLSRRGFFHNVSKVVAGTATGVVLAKTANAMPMPVIDEMPEKKEPPKAKGYQRTEHVSTYYNLADF